MSSTKGHVSHVLSSQMSSRPMGGSRKGAAKMAELKERVKKKCKEGGVTDNIKNARKAGMKKKYSKKQTGR